jgi:hypothetical protein
VRPLNTHFNPAVVNKYQLFTGVHVLNDLMVVVLAVPNGKWFRSTGVWNCVHVRNDLTVSAWVNTKYYYQNNIYRMQRSSQASYLLPIASILIEVADQCSIMIGPSSQYYANVTSFTGRFPASGTVNQIQQVDTSIMVTQNMVWGSISLHFIHIHGMSILNPLK